MKRREFLKSSLLLAAVTSVVSKTAGLFNEALAAGKVAITAKVGKLGYVNASKKAGKECSGCKQFKAIAGSKDVGECILATMKVAGKNAIVASKGYCNMWAKKA